MSDNSDKAAWQVTTDRKRIRAWAEDHETVPVLADETGGTHLLLLSTPTDDRGERLSWDQFFERFETESLALRYRETAISQAGQPAYEFVGRDESTGAEVSGQETADSFEGDTHEDDRDSQSTSSETEGAGVTQVDGETAARSHESATKSDPPTSDREVDDAAERDTAMSESSRGVESGVFVLDEIHEDRGLVDDVEDEYVTFRNTGDEGLNLSGWVVENEDGQRFVFPDGFTHDSGQNVTLHSGRGSDTEVYWGATSGVWDGDGDTVTVRTADGQEVLREPYLK